MPSTVDLELIKDIEDLIKKYNKKPDKNITKKDIVTLLQGADVIVPGNCNIKASRMIDEIIEGINFRPDVVKDGGKVRLLPVFTSYEQIPQDYLDTFSFMRVNAGTIYKSLEECDNIRGMVVNPFTEYNLEIKKKHSSKKTRTSAYAKPIDTTKTEAIIMYNDQKYVVKKTPFTIGRENTNIEIPESYISKIHVVISFKDGKYRIADYASTNGTKVNGTVLRPKVYYEIRDGYEIELSDKEKMFVYIK